jgi:gamma-carbonic anhydrase
MAAASLPRLSRRATATGVVPSLRRLLSTPSTAASPAAQSPPPPPSAAAPEADRVRWDYRGQRQLVPLGQWMPKVAVDAYVAPEAVLAGQVTVYDGASVWSGSVLRGDLNKITLGFCANVQERCVLHAAWSAPTGHLPRLIRFYNLPSCVLLDLATYGHLVTVLPFWDARECDAEW